ncbi:MAG: hypothetical protein PHQ98_01075 [Candidatus ainarchaeum sp.]|nr:hypothetical protein [Candidatus ainarchaeum sp.]
MNSKYLALLFIFSILLINVFAVSDENLQKYGGNLISFEEHGSWQMIYTEKMKTALLEKDDGGSWLATEVFDGTKKINDKSTSPMDITLDISSDSENWVIFHHYLVGGIHNSWKVQVKKSAGDSSKQNILIYKNNSETPCFQTTTDLKSISNNKIDAPKCGVFVNMDYETIFSLNFETDVDIRGFGILEAEYNRILNEAKKTTTDELIAHLTDLTSDMTTASNNGIRIIDLTLPNNFFKVTTGDSKKFYLSREPFELVKNGFGANNLVVADNGNIKYVFLMVGKGGFTSDSYDLYVPNQEMLANSISSYNDLIELIDAQKFTKSSGKKVDDWVDFFNIFSVTTEVASYASTLYSGGATTASTGGTKAAAKLFTNYSKVSIPTGITTTTKPILKYLPKSISVKTPLPKLFTNDSKASIINTIKTSTYLKDISGAASVPAALNVVKTSSIGVDTLKDIVAKNFVIKAAEKAALKSGATKKTVKAATEKALDYVAAYSVKESGVRTIAATTSAIAGNVLIGGANDIIYGDDQSDYSVISNINLDTLKSSSSDLTSGEALTSVGVSAGVAGVTTGVLAVVAGASLTAAAATGGAVVLGVLAVGALAAVPIYYYADSSIMEYDLGGEEKLLVTYNTNNGWWPGLSDETLEQLVVVDSSKMYDDFDFDTALYSTGYVIFELDDSSIKGVKYNDTSNWDLDKYFNKDIIKQEFFINDSTVSDNLVASNNNDSLKDSLIIIGQDSKKYLVINNLPITYGGGYKVIQKLTYNNQFAEGEFIITDPVNNITPGKCLANMSIDIQKGICVETNS